METVYKILKGPFPNNGGSIYLVGFIDELQHAVNMAAKAEGADDEIKFAPAFDALRELAKDVYVFIPTEGGDPIMAKKAKPVKKPVKKGKGKPKVEKE